MPYFKKMFQKMLETVKKQKQGNKTTKQLCVDKN